MSGADPERKESPTRALDVDLSDLLAGLAFLSGGQDRTGHAIVTIPTGICLDETGIESLARILKYYVHVAREDTQLCGCAVYMDLSSTDVESRVCILLALQRFKKWFNTSVGSDLTFYFITAQTLPESKSSAIAGLLESCVGQHKLISGFKELAQYATQDQRTEELRGTLPFDLDSWVQWRFNMEPFFSDCTSSSKRACVRLQELQAAGVPSGGNTGVYTEELMKLKLDTLINEGSILLERLSVAPKDPVKLSMSKSRQFRQAQEKISGLNLMLRELRNDLAKACGFNADEAEEEKPAEEAEDADDGTSTAVSAQLLAEVQQVSEWICQTGLAFLSSHCQKPGYTKDECRADLDSFVAFCAEHADGYISRGVSITDSISGDEAQDNATLLQEAKQLQSLVVTFQNSLREWRERIDHALEWHTISSEIVAWAALCMKMLISAAVTGDDLSAEDVLCYVDKWLLEHPAPSEEQRQRLLTLSFALRRHNFFSAEAETVRSALNRAETQFRNERATVGERIKLRSEALTASTNADSAEPTADAPSEDSAATAVDGDAVVSIPMSSTPTTPGVPPSDLMPVAGPDFSPGEHFVTLQQKMAELLGAHVLNDSLFTGLSEEYTDTSSFDSFDSDSSSGSATNLDQVPAMTVSAAAADGRPDRATLGCVSRVSIANIAATPLVNALPQAAAGPASPDVDDGCEAAGDSFLNGDSLDAGPGVQDEDVHVRKQRYLMKELLTTEVKYIEDLDLCIREFILYSDNDSTKPRLLVGKKNIIFGNMERIYDFNKNVLLPAFQALADCPLRMGSVFTEHESGFGLYSVYFKNMPQQEELLEDCMQYFRSIQIKANDPFTLNSYLLKPFQRMTRYRQFIEGIQKHVTDPEQHEVREELRAGLWVVCFHLRHGNDLLALDRLKGFDGNPAEQGMLLRQDDFTVVVNKQFRSRKRRVFLFEEMVVVSELRPAKSKKLSEDTYSFKDGYRLGDVTLAVSAVDKKFELCFKKHTKITFQTEKEDTKQDWVADIQKLLYHQAARLKERMAHISSGIEAPIFDRASWSQGSVRGSRLSGRGLLKSPPTSTYSRVSYQSVESGSLSISSPLAASSSPEPSYFEQSSIVESSRGSVASAGTLKADDDAVPDNKPQQSKLVCRVTSL